MSGVDGLYRRFGPIVGGEVKRICPIQRDRRGTEGGVWRTLGYVGDSDTADGETGNFGPAAIVKLTGEATRRARTASIPKH